MKDEPTMHIEVSQYYKDLLKKDQVPMAIYDSQMHSIAVNELFSKELLYPRNKAIPKEFDKLIIASDPEDNLLIRQLIIGNIRKLEKVYQFVNSDGELIEKIAEIIGIVDDSGTLFESVVILKSAPKSKSKPAPKAISSRSSLNLNRVEEAMQNNLLDKEEICRTIFQQTSDGIIILDLETMMPVACNPKVLEFYGCSYEGFIQRQPHDFSPKYQSNGELSSERIEKLLMHAVTTEAVHFEWDCLRVDGTTFLGEFTGFVLSNSSQYIILVFKDITAKRMMEKERAELERLKAEEAIKKERLEKHQIEAGYRDMLNNTILNSEKDDLLEGILESLEKLNTRLNNSNERDELTKIMKTLKSCIDFSLKWEKIQFHFERVFPGFLEAVKGKHPKLSQRELKHCAYILLGLTSKEVAQLRDIEPPSVDMAKFRMKKKLGIPKDQRLFDYLHSIWIGIFND